MEMLLAAGILALFFVVAEYLSKKTHGILSAFFLVCVFLLIGTWTIFGKMYPETDIVATSGALSIIFVSCGLYLTHIGTMITIKDLLQEWKTVVIGFVAVAIIGVVGCLVGGRIMEPALAYAGTPVVAGGAAANLIVTDALTGIETAKGIDLTTAKVFAVLVLALQFIIGTPICSVIVRKDAEDCLKSGRIEQYRSLAQGGADSGASQQKALIRLPEIFQTPNGALCLALFVSMIGTILGNITGVSFLLWCMLLGVLCRTIGLLPANVLSAAHSDGYIVFAACCYVIRGMKDATPELCVKLIVPLIEIFVLGILAIALAGFISSKIFKMSFKMCFAIGLTAMFGAPGTVYISEEVSAGVANGNEADRLALRAYILPKMMIAGFSTLTVGSVLLAGVIAPLMNGVI